MECPINECPGQATKRHNMRRHFAEFHPNAKVQSLRKDLSPMTYNITKLRKILQGKRINEEIVKQNVIDNQVDINISGESIEKKNYLF